ncbi:O-antigen polymerase [Cobetia marina]|uniref:O-antigen polymerase n=1 Tax=Cobetia marina TaxID=28258 RepID=UPI00267BC63D
MISVSSYVYTNFIVIICFILFQIVYALSYGKKDIACKDVIKYNFTMKKTKSRYQVLSFMLLLGISIGGFTLWYNNFNLSSLFFRGGELTDRVVLQGPSWLLYHYFLKPIPAVCALVYALAYGIKSRGAWLLLILTFVISSPTSMARFQAAVIYIPLFLVFFKALRREFYFPSVLVFGLLFIFPLLDKFRTFSSNDGFGYNLDYSFLLSGHFDSYQNFIRVFDLEMISYGWQLLGAILFFVPRSIWPNKPVGSGYNLAQDLNLSLSNISLNYLGEGYINFGILGVLLFLAILGIFCGWFDRKFWKKNINAGVNISNIFYMFSLGLVFFLMRGDLMSSFAYSMGMLFSVMLVVKIFNKLDSTNYKF